MEAALPKSAPLQPPKECLERSAVLAFLGCLYTVFLWLGSALALGVLWSGGTPAWLKVLGAIPFLVIGGYGILLAGFMGHDGTHFTLSSNKVRSCLYGILMTCPIFPYLLMGFTGSHWNHHRFANTDQDPDSLIFARFKNFFSRAIFARPFTFYVYGTKNFKLALGIPLADKATFPLKPEVVKRLAQFNVLANALSLGIQIYLLFHFPIYYLGFLAVLLSGSVVSGLSPYIEHNGTSTGRGRDTRTAGGRWFDVLLLGNSYHQEHHLYPTVPFYRLKRAHRHLREIGFYDEHPYYTRGPLTTYRLTGRGYAYPQFHRPNTGA